MYGPHISALYVRSSVLQHSVTQIVHHFLKVEKVAYKLQPGGPGYEIVYGTTGVNAYLLSLTPKEDLKATFEAIAAHEQTILEPLLSFLTDPAQRARGVRIVGEETVNLERVPTVSFVVIGQRPLKSRDIVDVFDKKDGVSDRTFLFRVRLLIFLILADWYSLWPFLRIYAHRRIVTQVRHGRRGS